MAHLLQVDVKCNEPLESSIWGIPLVTLPTPYPILLPLPPTSRFVSADWPAADESSADIIMTQLRSSGYELVTDRSPAVVGGSSTASLRSNPAVRALVDYELALQAESFLGHSGCIFSSLVLLQRRRSEKWAGHFNPGDIILSKPVPLFPTPWVFTFNSWGSSYTRHQSRNPGDRQLPDSGDEQLRNYPGDDQESMLRVAVLSAIKKGGGSLEPICIHTGDKSAPITSWLESQGVRVLHHDPSWRRQLLAVANRRVTTDAPSWLRHRAAVIDPARDEGIISQWLRIDVPVTPWVDQYHYVIYTDNDIMILRPFDFWQLPRPLPETVGMGPDMLNRFPWNAGVIVMNVPRLRETHPRFLDFVMSNKDGLLSTFGSGVQVGFGGGV